MTFKSALIRRFLVKDVAAHTVFYTLKRVQKQRLSIVAVAGIDGSIVSVAVAPVKELSVTNTRHVKRIETLEAKVFRNVAEKIVHLVAKASSDARISADGAENVIENKLHVA